MDLLGKPLSAKHIDGMTEKRNNIEEIMKTIDAEVEWIKNAGVSLTTLHDCGETSVWEHIEYLVDPGTCCLQHQLNPSCIIRSHNVKGLKWPK